MQQKAFGIFSDGALQTSESNEYTPLLHNLASLLSSNVKEFMDTSKPEGIAFDAYRTHYYGMKRFNDDVLDMSEVTNNMPQINTESTLRDQLNQLIRPKYLASGGQAMVNYQPRGTDTVPAMLTPGEFVVNRQSTAKHLPLLRAINNGSADGAAYGNGVSYARSGGIINPIYRFDGGTSVMGAVQSMGKAMGFDTSGISSVFNNFITSFNTETNNFGSLINNLAKVFPALGGPVSAFGGHVDKLVKALNDLKSIEIKGPNIPDTITVNSDTIRVELIAPQDTNYKLSDEDRIKITQSLETRLKTLTTLGR
jgi:hypothetical protein